MNGFDVLIIIALAAGAAWGFIKGLIHQAIGLLALYISLIVATVFYFDIAPGLQRVVHLEPKAAGAVAFLCSSDADYITGQTLNVDGGFEMN